MYLFFVDIQFYKITQFEFIMQNSCNNRYPTNQHRISFKISSFYTYKLPDSLLYKNLLDTIFVEWQDIINQHRRDLVFITSGGKSMSKKVFLSVFLIAFLVFVLGCNDTTSEDTQNEDAATHLDLDITDVVVKDTAVEDVVMDTQFEDIEGDNGFSDSGSVDTLEEDVGPNDFGGDVTPVYVTICSHNETDERYAAYDTFGGYIGLRNNILKIGQLVKKHSAKWDFEPDWKFLEAALKYEKEPGVTDNTKGKNILRYLKEELGVQIDPHSHETNGYNYADIAYLIYQMGVEPTGIVGGFIYYPPESAVWEKFWNPLTANKYPPYVWQATALWGGGTYMHMGPDDSSFGIWRPKDKYNFTVDNPNSKLPNIGNGDEEDITSILELIHQIETGNAPAGKLYTASYMVFELIVETDYGRWEQDLTTLDQYVSTGQVVYANLNEVLDIWRTQYNSEAFRYEIPSTDAGSNDAGSSDAGTSDDVGLDGGQLSCANGEVCPPNFVCCTKPHPCAGKCVPDCRVDGGQPCPPQAPNCDQSSGLCIP
jgi:hypothetical protein